jgi:hypothetical protein
MSHTYTSEEERREAAELAHAPSDEGKEAPLRDDLHHGRETVYVSPQGGREPLRASHPSHKASEQARARARCGGRAPCSARRGSWLAMQQPSPRRL